MMQQLSNIAKKGDGQKEEKKEKPKKKTPKDANGNELKRPLSAYMLYNNHRRPVLRQEHPGKYFQDAMYPSNLSIHLLELSLPDLSKLIGDEWKKLSENQRAVSLNQNYQFSLFLLSDSQ